MTDSVLNDQYWSDLYHRNETRWDTGTPNSPLKEYIDQLRDHTALILIPGCGNAYEAFYLLEKGFKHITLVDISALLVQQLKEKFTGTPAQILHEDFFHHTGEYDLILEQTFFCALDPSHRKEYVQKMHALLKPGGKLAGVLFNRSFEGGPPFGGSVEEYKKLFGEYFDNISIEPCYNSIKPRQGTEVFFIACKQF